MVAPVANMATWLQEANTAITATSVFIKIALVDGVAAVRGMVTVETALACSRASLHHSTTQGNKNHSYFNGKFKDAIKIK